MFPVRLVKDPAKKPIPDPDCVIDPDATVGPVGVPEAVPVVVKLKGPPLDVVTEPLFTKLLPTTVIPRAPLVLMAPPKVRVPTDQVKLIDAALIAWVVIFVAELTTTAPRRVVPAVPVKIIFPIPAASVRSPGPSRVLEKVIGLPVAAVEIEVVPAKVTPPAKETAAPAVILLSKLTAPLPD